MPIYQCDNCNHRWEGSPFDDRCDYCGSSGHTYRIKSDPERLGDLMDNDRSFSALVSEEEEIPDV